MKNNSKEIVFLLDNSTLLEAGELLEKGIRGFPTYSVAMQKLQNLLTLTHAILISDKIWYISNKTDRNNSGVDYLLSQLEDHRYPIVAKKIRPQEEAKYLSSTRGYLMDQLYADAFGGIIQNNKSRIIEIAKDEYTTFLYPHVTKLYSENNNSDHTRVWEHYWKNIGINYSDNKIINECEQLYNAFDRVIDLQLGEHSSTVERMINEKITWFVNSLPTKLKNKITKELKEYKWLPFLSHTVRALYYKNYGYEYSLSHEPHGIRKLILEAEIKKQNKDIKINADSADINAKARLAVFRHIMTNIKFNREHYLQELIFQKERNTKIRRLSKYLIEQETLMNESNKIRNSKSRKYLKIEKEEKLLLDDMNKIIKYFKNLPTGNDVKGIRAHLLHSRMIGFDRGRYIWKEIVDTVRSRNEVSEGFASMSRSAVWIFKLLRPIKNIFQGFH